MLSTPHMIGWMEGAGYEALVPFCEGDEVTVGTAINVIHRAPTSIGATVKCEAVLESINGRFLTFRVSASNGSEVIGYGTIGRNVREPAEIRRPLQDRNSGERKLNAKSAKF